MSQRPASEPTGGSEEESLDERIAELLRLAMPPGIAIAAAVAGYLQGPPMAVLVLAAGALFATVALFWSSLRALFGETRLTGADAFAIGAPSTEEEQKRAVLRALKDIEFERNIGKLSEQDYRILAARYRAEAKRLLRVLDTRAQPSRERAEKLVKAHLMKKGLVRHGDEAWAEVELDDGRPAGANPFIDEPEEADEEERASRAKRRKKKSRKTAAKKARAARDAADDDALAEDGGDITAEDDAASADDDDDAGEAEGAGGDDVDDADVGESEGVGEDDVDDADVGEAASTIADDADADDDEDDADEDDLEDEDELKDEDELEDEDAAEADADDAAPVAERSCTNCGALNDADALFCKKCGTRFEEASA